MVYDPSLQRDDVASLRSIDQKTTQFGLASNDDQINPKVLPRRYLEDEAAGRFFRPGSADFQDAFDKAGARWLSRDCHR
jgi:hypothetical protein